MKKLLTLSFHLLISSFLLAQSPQGIPYQAVMRDVDGSVMANNAVSLTFMIHDVSTTGNIVFQESHSLTSNAQGLVSCVVGNGVVSQGNFSNINWGNGAKFLHVMMGTTDLGTQQMLSVPYALYSNGVNVNISTTGDTLTIGNQSVIVPGISAANATNITIPTSGLGAVVLPGNNTCVDQFINVVGCNGQTSLTYDGRTYDLVEIGGQCWFADNLATDQYRNGDPIPTEFDSLTWGNTQNQTFGGAFSIYNDSPQNNEIYGKLYNWYTTVDSRGLCPAGWHVPSDCEWMYLESKLGMTIEQQEQLDLYRGTIEGAKLKSTQFDLNSNPETTNSSGFNGLPGGMRQYFSPYEYLGIVGLWWTNTEGPVNSGHAFFRALALTNSAIYREHYPKMNGYSVRCLKDSEAPILQGCTDGSACNFLANAAQDDGSCLYQNTTCDDGNANTVNDVINGECLCAGTVLSIGQDYQGGKVAYIFQPGDLGYVAGETHGLIAAAQDLPGDFIWGCSGVIVGAFSTSIGSGNANTSMIINSGCGVAANACADLVLGQYSDWFLPSYNELMQLLYGKTAIGGFQNYWYWSSTESSYDYASWVNFSNDFSAPSLQKGISYKVRPIRYF